MLDLSIQTDAQVFSFLFSNKHCFIPFFAFYFNDNSICVSCTLANNLNIHTIGSSQLSYQIAYFDIQLCLCHTLTGGRGKLLFIFQSLHSLALLSLHFYHCLLLFCHPWVIFVLSYKCFPQIYVQQVIIHCNPTCMMVNARTWRASGKSIKCVNKMIMTL